MKARDDRVSSQNLVMGLALLVIGGTILVLREGASRLGLITALVGYRDEDGLKRHLMRIGAAARVVAYGYFAFASTRRSYD